MPRMRRVPRGRARPEAGSRRELDDLHQRVVLALVEIPAADSSLDPTGLLEHAGGQRTDIAASPSPADVCEQIEIRARPAPRESRWRRQAADAALGIGARPGP